MKFSFGDNPYIARVTQALRLDWVLALILLGIYLASNNYILGWDDQHLELTLLKHLIDPAYYKGDYYVESLAKHFSSFLFPILAKLITVAQIPTVYAVLFAVSRFALFYWLIKLWSLISRDRLAGFAAVFMFIVLGRTEEFLYRTFSHQEFSYIFIFAGFYYFYKERYILASLILGLGANIHAIYCLFPMIFLLVYVVLFHPYRFSKALKCGLSFCLMAMPFMLWQIPKSVADKLTGVPVPLNEWLPLYWVSNPQNFLFLDKSWAEAMANPTLVFKQLEPFVYLIVLYIFLLCVSKDVRGDNRLKVIVAVALTMIGVSVYFSYAHPSRFVIDLNLLREEQFMRLFLMANLTLWAVKTAREAKPWMAGGAALAVGVLGLGGVTFILYKASHYLLAYVLIIATAIGIGLSAKRLPVLSHRLRQIIVFIPILFGFVFFCQYHIQYLKIKNQGPGFWQLIRNWEDMQRYVQKNTPINAYILAPIDLEMGGFRIFSERKIVVCQRDCGIVGFDWAALKEWQQRMQDMDGFTSMPPKKPIDEALRNAILKYKVNYIVFMNYYAPPDNPIVHKIYKNDVLSLYEVIPNPCPKIQ